MKAGCHYARDLAGDPERQVVVYAFSGSVDRSRSDCHGEACLAQTRDVSAVCTIKEAKW